jgi:hypothetical protein
MIRRALSVAALCALTFGCGSSSKQQIAAAVITAGAAAALAAVNRAATAECWGQCDNGLICDSQSGLCIEPPETDPATLEPVDDGCIVEDDGTEVCPEDPETWATAEPEPEPPAPLDPAEGASVEAVEEPEEPPPAPEEPADEELIDPSGSPEPP